MDDSEIDLMSRQELEHIEMTGAEPSDDAEPTSEQVAAWIACWGESPYADFSVVEDEIMAAAA